MSISQHIVSHAALEVVKNPLKYSLPTSATASAVGETILASISFAPGEIQPGDLLKINGLLEKSVVSNNPISFKLRVGNPTTGPLIMDFVASNTTQRTIGLLRLLSFPNPLNLVGFANFAVNPNAWNSNPVDTVSVDTGVGVDLHLIVDVSTAANTAGESLTVESFYLEHIKEKS